MGSETTESRILAKIEVTPAGCWHWQGAKQPTGYGTLWNGARPEQAHRVSYRHYRGEIPSGFDIDHLCRNRSCVNSLADAIGSGLAQRERIARVPCEMGGEPEGQDASDDDCALVDTDQPCAGAERSERGGELGRSSFHPAARDGDVGDAESFGRDIGCGSSAQGYREASIGSADAGSWDGSGWLAGADGKARRVEPGLRLLAHGVPARVGKLRAYGNAIVPQVAAEVIGAFLDVERSAA